jgi:Uma2 family endonuclease
MTLIEPPLIQPTRTAWHSLADILLSLGDIPADRIRWQPIPGTATEADCLHVGETERLCELVDGTLVEKAMGTPEGFFGQKVAFALMAFVSPRRLGMVIGEGGFFRLGSGNVRLPDASFTRRDRLPNPLPQVGGWCPDLCVEVLSPGNTRSEMRRKRNEYFASGCQLLWVFDRKRRTCEVVTNETESVEIGIDGTLDGGTVLPGFQVSMRELFAEIDEYFPDPTP